MKNNNDVDDGVYDWNLLSGNFSYLTLYSHLVLIFVTQVVVVGNLRQ